MTSTDAGAATGTLLDAHVRGYAQAVRLHLADLGPEVAEDLTDGLEADLAEAIQEAAASSGGVRRPADVGDDVALDLAAHFGPASAYAAELRIAAGLPPAGPPRGRRPGLRSAVAALRERWAEAWRPVTSTPQWAALRALARELRPVWWVARGWIIGTLVVGWSGAGPLILVPRTVEQAVVMAACALVSVQWARGRWLPRTWLPRVTAVATVAAVLLMPGAVGETRDRISAGASGYRVSGYDAGYQAGFTEARVASYGGVPGDDGVWVDGMQVSNLFAYDANGDPIKDVQLFDDRGRPVRTITDGGTQQTWAVPDVEGSWYFRPAEATDGRERWNVYPLRGIPETGMEWSMDETWEPVVGVQPEVMPWPFLKAPTVISGTSSAPEPAGDTGDGTTGDDGPNDEPTSGTGPTPGTDRTDRTPTRDQTPVVDASAGD